MAGKVGESKWITASELIELFSGLHPNTMVAANDHYNLSLYEPCGMPDKYIGVIDIRTEVIVPKWASGNSYKARALAKTVMPENSATLEITTLREDWLSAVEAADAERLASLVTKDVVVVHGDGRCIRGKDELEADFRKAFESFRIHQTVLDPEITIRGDWAIEIARVESTLTPVRGGEAIHAITTTLVAMRRQPDGAWKVARVVGLLE